MERNVRERRASIFGIVVNLLLAAAKIAVGVFTGLLSVAADGINNLSDCGSSVVALVSVRISEKPADREHPYGHRRAEYVASLLIGVFILVLAVELVRDSVLRIVQPQEAVYGAYLYALMAVFIAVKIAMFFGYRLVEKKTGSKLMRAAAKDSLCDCAASFVVLLGAVVGRFTDFPADGVFGCAVALFIAWEGISILRDSASELIGHAPDQDAINRIHALICDGEGVLGVHDLRIFNFGKDHVFASAHIEMDSGIPALRSHALIDAVERRVYGETGVQLTLHLDPVDLADLEEKRLFLQVCDAVYEIDERFSVHDFRLDRSDGTTKVVFEVAIPYGCESSEEEVAQTLSEKVKSMGDYIPVVFVERQE